MCVRLDFLFYGQGESRPDLIFLFLPIPLHTMAEGVVWLPEDAQIRAGHDGFVERVLVQTHTRVEPGDPILMMSEPLLTARVAVLEAELRSLRARHHAERSSDLVRAQISQEELDTAIASLMRAGRKGLQFVLSQSTTLDEKVFKRILKKIPVPITTVWGRSLDVVEASQLALVTSGTATLETALLQKPFFILYKATAQCH